MTIQDLLTISWQTGPPGSGVLPCQHEDPRLWFAERPADLEQAKAFCQPCPVRALCLAGATERQEPHGVWGGEIFEQGTIIAMKRPRGRPPKKAGQPCTLRTRTPGQRDRSGAREVTFSGKRPAESAVHGDCGVLLKIGLWDQRYGQGVRGRRGHHQLT